MAELTNEMVERRFAKVSSNPVPVNIPALPGLCFVPMQGREKGISSRAYSSKLMELHKEGGYYSEALLPTVLRKICEQNGIDIKVLDRKMTLNRKLFESIPEDLSGPYDQLTQEEVAELPAEEQEKRQKAIEECGHGIAEFVANIYTDEEKESRAQIVQIETLEQELRQNTYEFHARRFQMQTEILLCTRQEEDPAKPYFVDMDELEMVRPVEALVNLFMAWKQFREGMPSDFFSRS
ncbi:MAG: hypothetical protein ACYCX4_02680 [Bacillota bacterium]